MAEASSWPNEPDDGRDRRPWIYLRLVHAGLVINTAELQEVIERPAVDAAVRDKVFSRGADQEKYFSELYIRLHNYAAVVATLIALSRPYMEDAKADAFRDEQATRVAAIGENGAGQVLQGLRNYLLHNKVPYMEITVDWDITANTRRSVLHISSKSLLEWGDWKPAAIRYLEARPMVAFNDVIAEYAAVIDEYYSWLWSQVDSSQTRG